MDVNHVNPFMESFLNVMPQLGFSKVEKGHLSVKGKDLLSSGVIIIVGIVGAIKGNIVYSIDIENAKKIASTMMMGMPVIELDDIAKSALSELTNMLTANAATRFSVLGIPIDISTPTLLHGNDISLKMSSNQVLCIELLADNIPIEVNIAFDN
ncbi:chemotaxis protein CheX [[Clostridium] fimetarium]|uniref:Chemotaxis protein CheX n=1 Tax=[Clostridium] fimetarium TaxID=99656 RepID=A0A1I0PKZ0_9FIRM|nr:chemotaxis protein CheX [[Clostridium] fimetarium]SEW14498.1 chemotaxis protein CheX [[Clostridium] fimetarium]